MPARARALLFLALAGAWLSACAGMPAPVETGQLFLWEVERGDGTGGVAHLLGSVHMAEDPLAFDPAVESALAEAQALVLEVDPAQLEPAEMAQLTVELGYFTDGRTLDQVLGPELWQALTERAATLGLPAAMFRPMEPWLAWMTLQTLFIQREGFDPEQGVETALTRVATEEGKPTLGLETAESQVALLDSLPFELQERMLSEFLSVSPDDDESDEQLSMLIEAWRKGDTDRVEAAVFAELEQNPALAPFYESMYFERNRDMAQGIAKLVDGGGRWFVAVGAAHVVGAQGIPSLLAERGYAVRRLPKTVH